MAEPTQAPKAATLHVTQDDHGLWALSLEHADGTLELLAYASPSREHVVDDAKAIIQSGRYRNATLQAEDPHVSRDEAASRTRKDNRPPAPRRFGEAPPPARSTTSAWVYWVSDGVGSPGSTDGGLPAEAMFEWIYQRLKQNDQTPSLIVYGGDVYDNGAPGQFFQDFYGQLASTGGALYNPNPPSDEKAQELLGLMCHTTGNHDWHTLCSKDDPGYPYPLGYDQFWSAYSAAQHKSKQPIDGSKTGGARYEHCIDLNGWRMIFLDTGALDSGPDYNLDNQFDTNPWPMGDDSREELLDTMLNGPAGYPTSPPFRANIVFAHHSRLSCGQVGDNIGVDAIWRRLFDDKNHPRAVCTLAGHDHNVSLYAPRDRYLNPVPCPGSVQGVQAMVNGAGGYGLFNYVAGTRPEIFPNPNGPYNKPNDSQNGSPNDSGESCGYCLTQIELVSDAATGAPTRANFRTLSFGLDPNFGDGPTEILLNSIALD